MAIVFYGLLMSFISAVGSTTAQAQTVSDFPDANPGAQPQIKNLDDIVDPNAKPDTPNFVERPEDSLLIVGLLVDDQVLDQGFVIYVDGDDLIIPLGALSERLGFPIQVDTNKGTAKGWFVNEDRTLNIEKPYNTIMVNGAPFNLLKGDVIESHEDDIYMNKTLVERIFPVALTFNFNELSLSVTTKEDLPFQAQSERREKWKAAKKQSASNTGLELTDDVIRLPHRKFAPPAISINQSAGISKTGGEQNSNSSHTVSLQGDFLHMDMRSNFGYRTSTSGLDDLQNIQFTLSKNDLEGKLLGRLNATEVELGDTTAYTVPLAASAQRGRGLKFSNRPVNFVRDANDFFIEGFGPIGWDVELYQDERLLDFLVIDDSGRYVFSDLTLQNGFNLFRIVLYGPNGERREQFERFYLGPSMIDPGEFIYEVSALQSSSPLLDFRKEEAESTDPTFSMVGEYGINKNLSASLGYFHGNLADSRLSGLSAGLRLSGKSTFTQIDSFRSNEGETSLSGRVTGNLSKNITWNIGHTQHRGYDQNERSIERETFINFAQQISSELFPDGTYSFGVERALSEDGITRTQLTNRVSAKFMGFNFSNELEYTIRSSNSTHDLLGTFTVRRRLPIGNMRGRLNYRLKDTTEIDSIEFQFQNKITKKIFLNTLINSRFGDDPETRLTSGLDIRLEKYRLGLDTSISDSGDIQAGLNLSYNFVPTSLKGDYKMTGDTADYSTGQLILEPYLDSNANNIKDEGEETLKGVSFRNALRGTSGTSDAQGFLSLAGLSPNTINRILIDQKTLPDIFMAPASKQIKVLGKQGVSGPIQIPIHKFGEATGIVTLYDPAKDEETSVEGVRILLLAENGETIAETITEFDGFYVFPSLPLGKYKMFFPKSNALNIRYSGEGMGPSFTLTSEEPELFDGDIFIAPNHIDFRSNISEDSINGAKISQENAPSIEFMGLNTTKQAP